MRPLLISIDKLFSIFHPLRKGMNDRHLERGSMVSEQLALRGIRDARVLAAMGKVERHRFVPVGMGPLAYQDSPLPIGSDQTVSQPYIVALMTELLALKGEEKVLEIGTGSGYQAAILGEMAREVYSLEVLGPLAEGALELLNELGYQNIHVKCADGYGGWREQAPFDRIIVTCAPPDIPGQLVEQLAQNGRMVIPVGVFEQDLYLVQKVGGKVVTTNIAPVRFVPMIRSGQQDGLDNRP
jgi:protein-L-isoaspartate(D-aspartate) O-methyltransferase